METNCTLILTTPTQRRYLILKAWSRRIPKKRNTSIYAIPDPNEAAFGWGIHIVKGYDLAVLGC